MSELRSFGTEDQIAAIDGAVGAGWSITGVAVDQHFNASVSFAKTIREPTHPEHLFNGDTLIAPKCSTVTQSLGCSYEAMMHAKRIMIEGTRAYA